MMVIVPNFVSDAINRKLDEAITACPGAEVDRAAFYQELLAYYNEHGALPEFTIQPPPAKSGGGEI